MIVEYYEQLSYTKSFSIDDIGNFAIKATSTADGLDYFMVVKTEFGKTAIVKFGPIIAASQLLLPGYFVSYTQIDYKESKIERETDSFVNDGRKLIDEVQEISIQDALKMQIILTESELNP